MEPLHPFYERFFDILDIAFQPIVDIHSGDIFGVEALLRGTDTLGYSSIEAFFDHLYEIDILYTFDLRLREKVIQKFCTIPFCTKIKLFYNLDNRLFQMSNFSKGNTSRILQQHGLDHKSMIFELSEHNEITNMNNFTYLMDHYRHEGYCIAIDDFGIGQSGFKLLYHTTPNIIKIDRFFLSNIHKDAKKKLLTRQIVQLSTLMGCRIIAEGVETEEELTMCKELGCHMIQGYFVQRPNLDVNALELHYPLLQTLDKNEKRMRADQVIIRKRLEPLVSIRVSDSMETLLEMFNAYPDLTHITIVDHYGSPLGIIHEHRLKSIIYSPFGQSLMKNNSTNFSMIETYIDALPIVDITMPLETIVELFSLHDHANGVLVIESSKYIGYLSARVLIEAVHERNLIRARDQNPLSRLPGNFMINEQISSAFVNNETCGFCYFDFDHFKPYNDYYGFRNGDRVIVLFAEILHKVFLNDTFIGHIGGDDFFALSHLKNTNDFTFFLTNVQRVIEIFSSDVQELYSIEDRQRGSIITEDRDGHTREFKLLNVSAVIVHKTISSSLKTPEDLQKIFAVEKKNAKKSTNHIQLIID